MEQIPMLLWCPECRERHIDEGEFATKAHHTHACQHCGHCWRPAIVPTCGVRFLPGFKNESPVMTERERCAMIARGATANTRFQTVEHYKMAAFIEDAILNAPNAQREP